MRKAFASEFPTFLCYLILATKDASNHHIQNEPLKMTVRRVRKKVKITFNKPRFEEQINNLRELNDDLRRLREQAAEIKQPILRNTACVQPVHQLSQEYGSIVKVRRASKAFHQALTAAWSESNPRTQLEEVRHSVKLKLDTQVLDNVKMEVAIACYGHSRLQPYVFHISLTQQTLTVFSLRSSTQSSFINLHVQSHVLDFVDSGLNTPPPSGDDDHRKKRKVRFNFEDSAKRSVEKSPATKDQGPETFDLRLAQDICTALQATNLKSCNSMYLGYLDSCCNETFRHKFFGIMAPRKVSESICISTEEILSRPAESSVTLVDQLRLARNFAMAVLKFYSTPWLRDYITIQDFSFFYFDDSDLSSCIQTAHLGFDFLHDPLHKKCPIEDMVASEAIEDARLAHGVRNVTLWGLGTVLYVPFQ